jgi:methionyl-tRNA synthetase
MSTDRRNPIVVTSALPYANDRPHLGHLRSTYLPADVYVRYLRRNGRDVVYICATDEHGTPIALRAEKEKVAPKDIADRYHPQIRDDLVRMGCSFDIFSRTTEAAHHETTKEFFKILFEKGLIYEQDLEQLRCPKCEKYLPDRYVEGVCPYCGFESARGDSCDSCGRYLRPIDLKEPHCAICGTSPEPSTTKHWFFRLTAFQDRLKAWLEGNGKIPGNVKNYALGWIKEGLKDWCITRDMSWGVPVPVEGAEGKVIYVWFDAPIGYISATRVLFESRGEPDGWKRYWQGEGEAYHFIPPRHLLARHAHGDRQIQPARVCDRRRVPDPGEQEDVKEQGVVHQHRGLPQGLRAGSDEVLPDRGGAAGEGRRLLRRRVHKALQRRAG